MVDTESGMSMPACASKRIQPSPNAGCRPRTRATSYAMSAHLNASAISATPDTDGVPGAPWRSGPGHLGSHTSAVNFGFGVLAAVLLLILPGAAVALAGRLNWPVAVAVGPALTYGVVGLTILPFGALGIPWNALTALLALLAVTAVVLAARVLLARLRSSGGQPVALGPALTVAAGVLFGAVAIGYAAWRGMPNWQSVPSTWDAVWHANTIRWILDTGQASPTPWASCATSRPTTRSTIRRRSTPWAPCWPADRRRAHHRVHPEFTGGRDLAVPGRGGGADLEPAAGAVDAVAHRGAAATAAALSASFTSVPYVEFDTASMPNMAAYGLAIPTFVLITSSLRHRDRIPLAVIALVGLFSVHLTGGVVVVTFVAAWWLLDALWRPVLGRVRDFATLAAIAVPTLAVLLPQFLGVLQQAEIIAGHAFLTHEGRKRALFDAVVQHTRHLNDYPIQNMLIALAGAGFVLLLMKRIWWPAAVWALLVISIVHSSAPFGGPVGTITGMFSDLFYSDPRRLSAVVTMLLMPMAGYALFCAALLVVAGARGLTGGAPVAIRAAASGSARRRHCWSW